MSVPAKLEGGNLIRRDPNRGSGSPYQDPPYIRLVEPLDLYLNSGCMALIQRASVLVLGSPDSAWVEVAVREVEGTKYIVIAPTTEHNPHKEPLNSRPSGGGAYIRTADDVLIAAGIAAVPGTTYRMDAVLIEDGDFKWALAANWPQARVEPKGTRATAIDEAAAATMEPGK